MSWNSGISASFLSDACAVSSCSQQPKCAMRTDKWLLVMKIRHFAKTHRNTTMLRLAMPALPTQASGDVATIKAKLTLDLGGFETTFGTYMLLVRICSYLENIAISTIFVAKMRFWTYPYRPVFKDTRTNFWICNPHPCHVLQVLVHSTRAHFALLNYPGLHIESLWWCPYERGQTQTQGLRIVQFVVGLCHWWSYLFIVCAFVVDGLLATAELFLVGMFDHYFCLFLGGAAVFVAIDGLVFWFLCTCPIGVWASVLLRFLWKLWSSLFWQGQPSCSCCAFLCFVCVADALAKLCALDNVCSASILSYCPIQSTCWSMVEWMCVQCYGALFPHREALL